MIQLQVMEEELIAEPASIVSRAHFEFLYCLSRDHSGQTVPKAFVKLLELLAMALELLRRELGRSELSREGQFWLKALLFLAFQGLASAQLTRRKERKDLFAKAQSKKHREESSEYAVQMATQQARVVGHLKEIMLFTLRSLELDEDGEFYRYFLDCSLKVLEQSTLYSMCKEDVLLILREAIPLGENYREMCVIRLLALIFEEEDSIDVVADFIGMAAKEGSSGGEQITKDVLVQLVEELPQRGDLTGESTALRNSQ